MATSDAVPDAVAGQPATRRLLAAVRDAGLELRRVLAARSSHGEHLAGWHGGHARVHRSAHAALLARGRLVERSLDDLAGRLSVELATLAAVEQMAGRTVVREAPPLVGGDPVLLRCVAGAASGHADQLVDAADLVERAAADVAAHTATSRSVADARAAAGALRSVASSCRSLDRWLLEVADALATADRPGAGVRLALLAVATAGPTRRLANDPEAAHGVGWDAVDWATAPDDVVLALLRSPALPTAGRDVVVRALLRRWADRLGPAVDAASARAVSERRTRSPIDRLVGWLDDRALDPLDAVVHVHTDTEEGAVELARVAAGLRALAARDDVRFLDARAGVLGAATVPGGPPAITPAPSRGELAAPTVRLAFGDPAQASHVAVLVSGTGTGVGRHEAPLADAAALHAAASAAAPPDVSVATVLELYDAPTDLVRAADASYARVAATELVRGLAAVPSDGRVRTTLVGHSYGGVVAARAVAAGAEVDALVALGAPGLGVGSVHDVGLPPSTVWAARAPGDPIVVVGDVAALARAAGFGDDSPLTDPLVAHGPDPAGTSFGARRLPTDGPAGTTSRGHLQYLTPGSASLAAVAAVVLGHDP